MTDEINELARLLPDPARAELSEGRHRILREQLMSQINDDRAAHPQGTARRRRLLIPAVAGALLVLAITVGASVLFGGAWRPGGAGPDDVPEGVLANPTETITHGVPHNTSVEQPPPFRVRYGGTELHLLPFTYCYKAGCVDGYDNDPPSIGSPAEIFVFVPVPAMDQLTVHQRGPGGDPCAGRIVAALVNPLGEGWYSVRPRGPAGEYLVDIFAHGTGDMIASVRWTTPSDQPLPDPTARLALIANHNGRPDSYGLELAIANLAAPPAQYSATITVTAGNGESMTFDATPADSTCVGEGAVLFSGPADKALAASRMGDFPFTMTVELVLDGVTHVATAIYPDDEIEGSEPSVTLEFTPPLR